MEFIGSQSDLDMVGTVLFASAYGLPGTYLTYVRYFGFFVSWYGWRALVGGMWHGTRGVDRLWWSMDQCNYNNSEHQFVWMFFLFNLLFLAVLLCMPL